MEITTRLRQRETDGLLSSLSRVERAWVRVAELCYCYDRGRRSTSCCSESSCWNQRSVEVEGGSGDWCLLRQPPTVLSLSFPSAGAHHNIPPPPPKRLGRKSGLQQHNIRVPGVWLESQLKQRPILPLRLSIGPGLGTLAGDCRGFRRVGSMPTRGTTLPLSFAPA